MLIVTLACISLDALSNMRPQFGGVSKTQSLVNRRGKRTSVLMPELIHRWNSSLSIGEPTHQLQSQASILQFVTFSKRPTTHRSHDTSVEYPNIASYNLAADTSDNIARCTGNLNVMQEDIPMTGVVFQEPEIGPAVGSVPIHPKVLVAKAEQQGLNLCTKPATSAHEAEHTASEVNQYNHIHTGKRTDDEYIDVSARLDPVVPGPAEVAIIDADGWGIIDTLGAWDCVLSRFSAMEEIPAQHKEIWASAVDTVLRRISDTQEEGEELNRALKWWLFLPQALCRQAGRGGRAGVGQIRKRFNCIVEGDFGELINLWKHDCERIKKREHMRVTGAKVQVDNQKKARQAVSLISKGLISKATNRMISHGVASASDPTTIQALSAKYPPRSRELPLTVTKGQAVESMKTLKDSFLSLSSGVAPGTGQLRPEFLSTLAEVWEEGCTSWEMLQNFSLRYINGSLPAWFYKCSMTVETVGMYKTADRDPAIIRPIGMRNPFIKVLHKEVMIQNKEVISDYLEPQQLGMSVAGGAKLVHSVRMTLESHKEFICIKLDFRNAFNEVSRARIIEVLESHSSLSHLTAHAATILAPSNGLESRGVLWGKSSEGATQGDPESGPYFCIAIQEFVVKVDNFLGTQGGCARFGWDDGYLIGPPEAVYAALESFSRDVSENCGLVLQRTKTEVFNEINDTQPQNGLAAAGIMIDNKWEPGMLCYGVPVGTDKYVMHMLNRKVDELEKEVATISEILEDERQAMWAVLRSSIAHKLDYWLTLVYPSLMKEAATRMDKIQSKVLSTLLGMHIPMQAEGFAYECPIDVPVENILGRSFQHMVIRQPLKMGGLGIRSHVETSLAAYIGGLEQALPHMTGTDGVCQLLEEVLGDGQGTSLTRWQPLIRSGCRTGQELVSAWSQLQEEARQCAAYLGQELVSPLSSPVECAGDGSSDGSTRRKVVQQREELRGSVLKEAMARIPNKKLRPCIAWSNRDKLSTAWLQCLPGPNGLNNQAFSEALALALCMPSPACQDRVGAQVGRSVVDIYGDKVVSTVMPGDHWRTRHDKIKLAIGSLCSWARLPVTTEVFGLFSHLIPAQALSRYERGRKRQALVPDFRLEMPCPTGGSRFQLAELKVISCCESWYTPSAGGNVRATEKRANGLKAEYRRKARDVDKETREKRNEEKGPVERRLEEFGDLMGLVFGAWGEASEMVHQLVHTLAESRLAFQGLQRGRPGNSAELGILTGQIRRRLSLVAIKAQTECLLSKIHQVGPGNKLMAKRRQWAVQEDDRMRRERDAQWLRRIEGVHTLRKGHIKTP